MYDQSYKGKQLALLGSFITLSSNWSMKIFNPHINIAIVSCVKITPLGSPLVPLVYIIVQMLIVCGGTSSDGFSFPYMNKIMLIRKESSI